MSGSFDVAVIGAGVFGTWTAYQLHRAGARVILLDAYGPANSRASSGGESRIIRLGYGPDEIYTRSAKRSFKLWHELFDRLATTGISHADAFFRKTGVLWLAHENDPYVEATLRNLESVAAKLERLDRAELERRYPQLEFGSITWGILESEAGALMARRSVQALWTLLLANGVTYLQDAVTPPTEQGSLNSIATASGEDVSADRFIFACGPWLPKVFPELLANRFQITRQEVFFLGVPPGNTGFGPDKLPIWIDFGDFVYGIPDLEGRGFKLAIDAHGPEFDPDSGERVVTEDGLLAIRSYLKRRVPQLADAPVTESRVCQYENTANGDFLIDTHPEMPNVWLVGGGSGHGFKHGPAVGEYVSQIIFNKVTPEPRFSLATKETVHQRKVY